MEDLGALVGGFAHSVQNAPALMLSMQNMRRKEEEDRKDRDMKAAGIYLNIMSSEHFADEIRMKAQHNFADIFEKNGLGKMDKVTEWAPEFSKAAKKMAKTMDQFKATLNGTAKPGEEISFEDAIANANSLYGEAKNAFQAKQIESMKGSIAKLQAGKEKKETGKVSAGVMAELDATEQRAFADEGPKIPVTIGGVEYQLGPTEWASVNNAMERMDQGWSAPYAGPGGSLLQRNNKGEVKSILGRHEPKDSGAEKMATAANLRMVKENVFKMWMPIIQRNIEAKSATPEEAKTKISELMAGIFTTDELGRNVNEARAITYLTKEQQKSYRQHSQYAERHAAKLPPQAAAEQGLNDLYSSWEKPPAQGSKKLDKIQAAAYMRKANGNRTEAERMAKEDGWDF